MTILNILQYPDPRLAQPAEKVEDFGPRTQTIIDDLFETHYAQENCAALAATQLGILLHITVIDFSETKDQPLCLVNTKLSDPQGLTNQPEGCMSVAGVYEKVKRAETIQVDAQDRHGNALSFRADGFMAKCIQHEIDHLHGKLFLDHLSSMKRSIANRRIAKYKRGQ